MKGRKSNKHNNNNKKKEAERVFRNCQIDQRAKLQFERNSCWSCFVLSIVFDGIVLKVDLVEGQ